MCDKTCNCNEVKLLSKELLIDLIANVDDIVKELTADQREILKGSLKRIYGNYFGLLENL